MPFPRTTIRPDQAGCAPCVRSLTTPVSVVVDMLADGLTTEKMIGMCPDCEREDIAEALRFAADAVRERELPLASNE